jgi:hypothetical protein
MEGFGASAGAPLRPPTATPIHYRYSMEGTGKNVPLWNRQNGPFTMKKKARQPPDLPWWFPQPARPGVWFRGRFPR